jgi:hypothetical protein
MLLFGQKLMPYISLLSYSNVLYFSDKVSVYIVNKQYVYNHVVHFTTVLYFLAHAIALNVATNNHSAFCLKKKNP